MASNTTQIAATAAPVNMDEFSKQMEQHLQTQDAQKAQEELSNMFVELGQNLNGQAISEVVTAEDFSAEKALGMVPTRLISNAVEASGMPEEDVKANFLRIFQMTFKVKDMFLSQLTKDTSDDAAAEPDEFQGVKRVQTMKPDEEIDSMEFDPTNIDHIMKQFQSFGLGESAEGSDNTVNLTQVLQQISLPTNAPATRIPIANSELAEERVAEYRKHVDAFIEAMDDEDATPETFGALIATLRSFPIHFEAREEATCKAAVPIITKIQEAHAQMERISAARNIEKLRPILAALQSKDEIDGMLENLLDAEELEEKWDEIEEEIDALIEEYEDAEAEAEEKAAKELAESLD